MKHFIKGALVLVLVALLFTPLTNVYAEPEDPDLDYEYCQSQDLTQVETYTVHFETYGGTQIEDAVSVWNCSLREMGKVPADPEKDGYTFYGWYKSADLHLNPDGPLLSAKSPQKISRFMLSSFQTKMLLKVPPSTSTLLLLALK